MKRRLTKNFLEIKLCRKTIYAILTVLCCILFVGCGIRKPSSSGEPEVSEAQESSAASTAVDRPDNSAASTAVDRPDNSAASAAADKPVINSKENDFEEKAVKIFEREPTDREVTLRFYKDTPHVPYMGIKEYFDLMLGGGLTVTERPGGKYLLTNAAGATAEVDTERGIVALDDLPSFENYLDAAREGECSSFRDSDLPMVRLRDVEYLDEPQRVEMDLGECGFALYGDGDEVYFPLSVLATWLTDIAQNTVSYNGRYLYICHQEPGYQQDNSYYHTEYYNAITAGQERAGDLADYSYADLCFIFRYMYGYPGPVSVDTGIMREAGLDEALKAYGEEGAKYREELASTDFRRFWSGMYGISNDLICDLHNSTELAMDLGDPQSIDRQKYFLEYIWEVMANESMNEKTAKLLGTRSRIVEARSEEYGDYYQYGDTAVIRFDQFNADRQAWEDYYKNGGLLPEDTLGIVAGGLRRASEDGGIRNIIFDVSANLGGYTDDVMGIMSLISGKEYLAGINELSQQRFRIYFDVDRNLDGVFDEKDRDVSYDFNYAALISNSSFSCGNLFPFLVREAGGMLIGERTAGGHCSIQKAALSEGFDIQISGYKFKLTDDIGSDLEAGAAPDVEIPVGVKAVTDEFTGEERQEPDYSAYGDIEDICRQVSEWYAQK